jgi:asparagine synthase (glutamine-hydrolysing)
MCGISAIFLQDLKRIEFKDQLIRMNSIIRHRGPDDEGYLLVSKDYEPFPCMGPDSNNKLHSPVEIRQIENVTDQCDLRFGLGFRRLSILDLSPSGHQPMSYLDGRYWIVFNGEIYNYIELRAELIRHGYQFKSNSDTEVIMASYDFWGTDCLSRFNGMWAFVLLDLVQKEIVVSRDRFGIKPLYYYFNSGMLLFASEIKQFLAFGGLNIEADVDKIKKDFLFDTKEYGKETPFKNVFRFPKGCYLKLALEKQQYQILDFVRYYNLNFLSGSSYYDFSEINAQKYAEEYVNLLEDAVKLRLRADVDVGTCFSGGLDSSSIVYMVNKILGISKSSSRQKTFSLIFGSKDTKYCDESEFINILSGRLNLNSFTIDPGIKDIIDEYEKIVFAMDTPQHSSLMSYFFTYKLVRENRVIVTLDGQGADELQAGYFPYLLHYFSNLPVKLWKKEYELLKKNPGSEKYILQGILFNLIAKTGGKNIINKILEKKGIEEDPWMDLNAVLLDDFNMNLQTLFHYGDRGSMYNSVESRFPMMDYRLVEFWMNLPVAYKIRNGYTKYIARIAMNNKLPEEIVWRRDKKGWEIPQKAWFNNGLSEIMQKKISASNFIRELGLGIDLNKLNRDNNDPRYWKLPFKTYNLALWHELFFERWDRQS